MMDFMFFVKTFLATLAVILLMQIKVGEKSVEAHTLGFVQSSSVTLPLNSVAEGGAKMVRDLVARVQKSIGGKKKAKKDGGSEATESNEASEGDLH
jgi:hypothetical protein